MQAFVVRRNNFLSPPVATIEMADSLEEAADAAASLVFDRSSVRRAVASAASDRGVFVAFGARRDGGDAQEVRFFLQRS